MSRCVSPFTIVLLMGSLGSLLSAGERSYRYYDIILPACNVNPQTEATDINDMGVVTGYYVIEDCVHSHAITWFNGVTTDLDDTYDGAVFRGTLAISETDVILGYGDPEDVLVLQNGIASPLAVPPGCEEHEEARDMNAAGTMVAGWCDRNGMGFFVPALYWIEEGVSLALDLLPGLPDDATGEGRGVNDDGVLIAQIHGEARSYTWIDGEITELPNLLGGTGATVTAINNHNLIVGEAEVGGLGCRAMSYNLNTGEMTALGLGRADAVNDRGSAVGRDIIAGSSSHVILYEDGEAIDLFELILGEFLDTTHANAINNYGWIVGWGDDEAMDTMHGWLLVPIYGKGDFDGDTDVDHQDFQHFQRCFAGEPYIDGTLHVGCSVFDFDDDVDLDLDDYGAFQSAFTGPTAPNNNPNGPG